MNKNGSLCEKHFILKNIFLNPTVVISCHKDNPRLIDSNCIYRKIHQKAKGKTSKMDLPLLQKLHHSITINYESTYTGYITRQFF
jgi:hypothetical protein